MVTGYAIIVNTPIIEPTENIPTTAMKPKTHSDSITPGLDEPVGSRDIVIGFILDSMIEIIDD